MSVSMIITTHNRTHLLVRSFERMSMGKLTLPDEIIVVDDGGTDNCKRTCDLIDFLLPIKYIRTENPGETNCCHARNVGLRNASSDLILTCEPEVMFITDVIPQLVAAHEEFPNEFLHGWCAHEDTLQDNTGPSGSSTLREFPYLNLYEKHWLEMVGGWDEEMPGPWAWDDLDLFGRLRFIGHTDRLIDDVLYRHQWHPSRIEPAVENEAYARAKEFPRDLVANKGMAWGTIKT